ncbi:hypothetical protein IHE45_19G146900 [Dioscorea alata]|uniref:Uncharacterized protein n=1 Tax=Dioscorea alata TaxID=55571 RepID=A0ACB7U2J5_DIOAL|nr:hypothetical protein IHE45_19G146900 [Dioscorea alata]
MNQFDHHQTPPQVYPPPTTAYPPPGQVAAPAPMGYPVNDDVGVAAPYQQSVPMETKSRGDGFWKGW